MTQPKIETVLVLPDIHVPVEDKKTMAAVEAYMADLQPDEIIYLGDVINLDCISSHNANNLRAVEGTRIKQEFDCVNAMLDRHEKLTPLTKRRTYVQGNHEFRLNRYVDANPQVEGILDTEVLLRLNERGYKYVPQWESGATHEIGKVTFIHGNYVSDGHAKKHVDAYGCSVVYGHVHDVQSYSKTTKGHGKTRMGQSLGCLCSYQQKYMRGNPSKWQQAFGVFRFFADGFYNSYVVSVFKSRFVSPEGWCYDGVELTKKGNK